MLRKFKFVILLALVAAGCMTANERSTCEEPKTIAVHDTVFAEYRDTILSTPIDSGSLLGVWRAVYLSQPELLDSDAYSSVTLVITKGQFSDPYEFSATKKTDGIATETVDGDIRTVSAGAATLFWTSNAGVGNCTWVVSMRGKELLLQQIGDGFFDYDEAIRFTR